MKKKKSFLLPVLVALFTVMMLAALIMVYIAYENRYPTVPPVIQTPVKTAYGIRIDSLDIRYASVRENQNFSALLSPDLPDSIIRKLVSLQGSLFDVRKMRAGNRIARIYTTDSVPRLLCFIYEVNPIDFVVFDLRSEPRIYRDKKKVDRLVKTATGTITSSLWNCFTSNNLDISLAMAMSEVYAWTVDFYGLQKGDNFSVVYEELFVDGKMIGIDRILASRFQTGGRNFYAYQFDQNGKGQYFDETGKSLQRSFLKAPLKFSRISSRFSRARMHPVLRIVRPHFGVDYSAPKGTPVVALGSGHVTEAGFKGGYGRFISIRHGYSYATTYAHLSGYAPGIRAGANVQQGQVIGYVGSSGLSTGPHLDFRVYKNGTPVDPLKVESPPTAPVNPADMPLFRKRVSAYATELSVR